FSANGKLEGSCALSASRYASITPSKRSRVHSVLVGAEVSGSELPIGPLGSLVSPLERAPSVESGAAGSVESAGPDVSPPVAPDGPGGVDGGGAVVPVPPLGPAGPVLLAGGVGDVELAGGSVVRPVVVGSGVMPWFLLEPHPMSPNANVKTTGAVRRDETRFDTIRESMPEPYQKRCGATAEALHQTCESRPRLQTSRVTDRCDRASA